MVLGNRARCLLVQLTTTGGLLLTWSVTHRLVAAGWRTTTRGGLASAAFDRVLADLCAVVLLCCAIWLWLACAAVVVEALRGPRSARRSMSGVPPVVRRVVLAACGLALAGGVAQPAGASSAAMHLDAHGHRGADRSVLDGLPFPDRAEGRGPRLARHSPTARPAPAPTTVVVEPGDTLWGIAADHLPARATEVEIDRRWRAIYRLNRALLGPDPDLIEPGQQLQLPRKETP
jgi:nucleoid-associated protein YgaU